MTNLSSSAVAVGSAAQALVPVEAPDLLDIRWTTKQQFIVAVEAGLAAAKAKEAGAPLSKVRPLYLSDDATFVDVLNIAHTECGVSQQTLAKLNNNTSHTTISRWISGKNLPRPMYRDGVIGKLLDHVREVRDLERKKAAELKYGEAEA